MTDKMIENFKKIGEVIAAFDNNEIKADIMIDKIRELSYGHNDVPRALEIKTGGGKALLQDLLTADDLFKLKSRSFPVDAMTLPETKVSELTVRDLNNIGLYCFYDDGAVMSVHALTTLIFRALHFKKSIF